METTLNVSKRPRRDFSKIRSTLPIPNLIDVQRRSYERFLQMNLLPEERARSGSAGGLHQHLSRSPTSARPVRSTS